MILVIFLLIILYFVNLYYEAKWDAEAFKEGDSNHKYKNLKVISQLFICSIYFLLGIGETDYSSGFFRILILVSIYICMRYAFFDTILNHLRNKHLWYKTGRLILKWLAVFFVLGLITLYFYL